MAKSGAQQIPLDLAGRSALGREDFLIGRSNREAVEWIDRWPEWPAPLLVISGPAASGKSHLAAVWRDQNGARMVEPKMLESASAEEIFADGMPLVLDGLDLWIGSREAETTLFHLYNMFRESGGFFLATSRMAPAALEFALQDLASRFRAAPHAVIKSPDDTLLASVLIKLFSDRQLRVGNDVVNYILPRMERSFVAARDLVAKIDSLALAQKRAVSIPLAREALMMAGG
ncbi:MAG: DNA replication protein [Alphaproteobacteria bacterium]|nr:DNA replication protein [Alphaproteobacteria bacterium]